MNIGDWVLRGTQLFDNGSFGGPGAGNGRTYIWLDRVTGYNSAGVPIYTYEPLETINWTAPVLSGPTRQQLSAVYTFYDPDLKGASLGTYNILWQIAQCTVNNLPYLYLGYWIRDCHKMAYKAGFRPIEGLIDGQWQSFDPADREIDDDAIGMEAFGLNSRLEATGRHGDLEGSFGRELSLEALD